MVGVYFSGTGNTKYCVEKFLMYYQSDGKSFSIENKDVIKAIRENKDIVFGYPIYYSNLPKIVKDFIIKHKSLFVNKNIFIITTMDLFSGDGAGCAARLFQKYNANITGGLHLKMPDCIGDVKLLKKTLDKNCQLVIDADKKIKIAANKLHIGNPTKDGLGVFSHIAGLLGQRLWFNHMVKDYSDKLKIDKSKCIGCGKCVTLCPMKNLSVSNKKAVSKNHCTMCYRCISNCPQRAITLLGKEVFEQSKIEKYIKNTP